jgi:uncharacterized protein (DUF58 family)
MEAKEEEEIGEEREEREKIRNILRSVKKVELKTRKLVDTLFQGAYKSVFKGRGIEFSEVREYKLGDDIRSIDWNVTSRMGKPYVKEFIEERDLTIIIAFDISSSLEFGTREAFKKDIALELISSISFSALQNNDRVGLVLFTDKVEKYIPVKKGRKHILRIIREILYTSSKKEEKRTDIGNCLKFLIKVLKKRAIVFLISDFNQELESFSEKIKILNKKHDLIAINVFDLREFEIPQEIGYIQLEDLETGEQFLLDTTDKEFIENYEKFMSERKEKVKKFFQTQGIDLINISTDKNWIRTMIKFFRQRRSRMR